MSAGFEFLWRDTEIRKINLDELVEFAESITPFGFTPYIDAPMQSVREESESLLVLGAKTTSDNMDRGK